MIDKRVMPLAIGGLAIGTTEFAIMGLLPDMAETLHISISQAGLLISAYALGVVVGAPILIASSLKYPPKKVVFFLMILFTIFNGLSAIAPNYATMLPVRFLSGLPHGAFFGVGTVIAARLAGKGREARYIALMFAGLTFANLAMVPFVTYIGHTYHWRWYFAIVTLIGLLTLLFIYLWLPAMEGKSSINLKTEMQFLRRKETWYVLLITAIGFGGLFAWFSYITPLMTSVSGIAPDNMAYIMMLAGLGMFLGNFLGGILTDKIGAPRTASTMLFLMTLALLIVFFFSEITPLSIVMVFLCGGLSMSVSSPLNMMIMKAAPGSEMMAAAFMQAAFNVANSAGAFFGGIPLDMGMDYTYPSFVGMVMAFIGLVLCIGYRTRYKTSKQSSMQIAD